MLTITTIEYSGSLNKHDSPMQSLDSKGEMIDCENYFVNDIKR